jgi:hypothetical protein
MEQESIEKLRGSFRILLLVTTDNAKVFFFLTFFLHSII